MKIYNLLEEDFSKIINLGNSIQGENYLNFASMEKIFFKGLDQGLNCNYVAYDGERGDKLIGFRLTYPPGKWKIDEWCTTGQWGVPPEKVCYFKSNLVAESFRGKGLGSELLNLSIEKVKQMGAVAGVAHIWAESPGNSAVKYFNKAGAHFIKSHRSRWLVDCILDGYRCIHHGSRCSCTGEEMIIYFGEQENE